MRSIRRWYTIQSLSHFNNINTILITRTYRRLKLEWKLLRIKNTHLDFNPKDSIVIFGDPRGGTTWLAEILNEIPNSIIFWEPLHLEYNEEIASLRFGWRQHIPKDAVWPEAIEAFKNILSLKILNEWTCMKFTASEFRKCRIPIIKFCRANHMVPWLCVQFKFNYKPVVLLRHPFAVAASQLKQGGWDYHFDEFHVPEMPYNDIYVNNFDFLKNLESKAQWLVAQWCITNMELVSRASDWHLLFYEELITDPQKNLREIFKSWKISVPDSLFRRMDKASSTNVDLRSDIDDQLAKWNDYFDHGTIDQLQEILDYFEVKVYSKDSYYPDKSLC